MRTSERPVSDTPHRSSRRRGKRRGTRRGGRGLWSPVPEPEPPAPIKPAAVPSSLIESLGPPPLPGHRASAEHYLAAVVERAAGLATALAASAALLDDDDESAER